MLGTTLIALGLFATVWIVYFGLRALIAISIDIEEQDLNQAESLAQLEHLKTISILRALEVIMTTVFMAVLPVAGIVIGAVLPDPVRSALSATVGSGTIIVVSIAALFADYSVFKTLRKYQGAKVRAAIVRVFRAVPGTTSENDQSVEGTPPPTTQASRIPRTRKRNDIPSTAEGAKI